MKLRALFLILFLASAMGSRAQMPEKPLNVGVLAGANLSSLSINEDGFETGQLFGFVGGGFVRVNIKKLYLQPEVLFSMRGANVKYDNQDFNVRLNNFDIPLMLGYKLVKLPLINLRVMAGPVASFNLSQDDGFDAGDFKTANWGIQAGLGVDVWKLTFDARYEFGINKVNDGALTWDDVQATYDGAARNNVLRLTLGFKFF